MDITELHHKPHLSASAIGTYIDCGLAYRFSKVDKIKPEFVSDALVYGTVIHHSLETFYLEKKFGKILSLKQVQEAFEEYWEMEAKDRDDIKYSEGKTYKSYLLEGKELLAAWYNKLPEDDFKIIGVEVGFAFEIEGIPVPIIGYIDLLEEDSETLLITDFKTTGRSYSADEIDQNTQMTVYAMAMKANGYADQEVLLRLDCLIKTKTPKFKQYYTIRTEDDEKRLIKKFQKVWDGITKGVFIPNNTSWKCNKGCQYKKACNDWFLEGGE